MLLNKSQILEAKDIRTEQVAVPEWGGDVLVSGMTAGEKDKYENGLIVAGETSVVTLTNATARLCSLCIRDEKGSAIFTERDITSLTNKSAKAMERVSKVAQRLSGMGKGDLEEIVKNSEEIQNADSD